MHDEASHFPMARILFTLIGFGALLLTSVLYGSKAHKSELPDWGRYTAFGAFAVLTLVMTWYAVKKSLNNHSIKEENGYPFVPADITFHKLGDVIKLAFFCSIAAVLCGMTGIAGGMVLGPLFLSYGMLPQVMSSTNQYITMIASFAVVIQFQMSNSLSLDFSLLFGGMSTVAAYLGINTVNNYIKKTGKQSSIAIILTLVLTFALLSLPLKYFLLPDPKAVPTTAK